LSNGTVKKNLVR